MKYILYIKVKMATSVGNLTFIKKINTTSEILSQDNFFLMILV